MLSEGENVPDHFSRPEVLEILKKYYAGLTEKVEIKLHSHAEGTIRTSNHGLTTAHAVNYIFIDRRK